MDKNLPIWLSQGKSNTNSTNRIEVCLSGFTFKLDSLENTAYLKKGCVKKEVVIPDSICYNNQAYTVVEISERAFNHNDSIEVIHIKGSNLIIRDFAFKCCSNLKKIRLIGLFDKIGKAAFYGCDNLIEIQIDGVISAVDSNVFAYCTNLEHFDCLQSFCLMSKGMFRGCSSLKRIIVPNNITEIPEASFIECSSLKEVILPGTLRTIGKYAFLDCGSLTSILVPEDTVLEYGCFNRTPLDSSWKKSHPISIEEKNHYSLLEEIKENLGKGIVLSPYRSVYDRTGNILKGDTLFNVIKDFSNGTSVHFDISDAYKRELVFRDYSPDRRVYFFPVGDVYKRVICGGSTSAHFIRMVENGNPLGKTIKDFLRDDGIPDLYLENPEIWMSAYLSNNPDIPEIVADALKGIGINVSSEQIAKLSMELIHTDESWSDYQKNHWDNNYLCLLVECINAIYMSIDKKYKSRIIISGNEFYKEHETTYLYLVNLILFRRLSHDVLYD